MPKPLFLSICILISGWGYAQTRTQLSNEEKAKNAALYGTSEQRAALSRIDENAKWYTKIPDTKLPLNLTAFTHRNYYIVNFTPITSLKFTPVSSSISTIKLIDGRYDVDKVSFLPVINDVQKKGYNCLGLQFDSSLKSWLKNSFLETAITTDSSSKRQLVIVIKKCWFSNTVNQPYASANPKLLTTLDYQFDTYTSLDIGYYPQKAIKGSFTTLYNSGKAYSELCDSLLTVLNKELAGQNFVAKEIESNWQSPVDFNDYYSDRIRKTAQLQKTPKGLYETYADFLDKKPVSDSEEMVVKYTNYERVPLYACQLSAFKEGQHVASNKSWGYFDGTSLFLNTGNGFYIKLIRSKNDYVFFDLKSIRQDPIKHTILEGIQIGGSPYQLLKDYTKAYALTYQLDMDTGKLY